MTFGDRLKQSRKRKKMTQAEVANVLGIDFTTISKYENDKSEPDNETLTKLAELYDVTIDNLLGRYHKPELIYQPVFGKMDNEKLNKDESERLTVELVKVPILGTIKAGYDLYADQLVVGHELMPREYVDDGEYFYLEVTGDSMIDDRIFPGDLVLVRRQTQVENGQIAVILMNGDEATLKRVYYQENGTVVLQASNRLIPPKVLPADDVLIQGQVTSVKFKV